MRGSAGSAAPRPANCRKRRRVVVFMLPAPAILVGFDFIAIATYGNLAMLPICAKAWIDMNSALSFARFIDLRIFKVWIAQSLGHSGRPVHRAPDDGVPVSERCGGSTPARR